MVRARPRAHTEFAEGSAGVGLEVSPPPQQPGGRLEPREFDSVPAPAGGGGPGGGPAGAVVVRRRRGSLSGTGGEEGGLRRCYSFSEPSTAPVVERDPVQLYISNRDACVRRLHVFCSDQVGLLFTLAELLARHAIEVETADIAVVGENVDNCFLLRAPRPSDFADAAEWCRELERSVKSGACGPSASTASASPPDGTRPQVLAEDVASAAARLGVNPHLLCVSSFHKASGSHGGGGGTAAAARNDGGASCSSPSREGSGRQLRYRMELKGINQAGVLAYISLVLSQSGFSIRRAHISTKDGQVSDAFELLTTDNDAVRRLQRYINLPIQAEESPSLPQLKLLWSAPSADPGAGAADDVWNPLAAAVPGGAGGASASGGGHPWPGGGGGGSGGAGGQIVSGGSKECLHLPNGDVYEGSLASGRGSAGNLGGQQRHGYGVYSYMDRKALYLRYSGQWHCNKKHGFGILLLRDGSAYAGQWKDNERHGIGVMFGYGAKGAASQASMPTYRYEGEWQRDKQDGIGVEETEEYLYCGRFAEGQQTARGLRSQLRKPGVAGCSALFEGGDWQPLADLLAADVGPGRGRKPTAHPFQALAGAYARADDLSDAPSAQTYHFGAGGAKSSRPALSSICFDESAEHESRGSTKDGAGIAASVRSPLAAAAAALKRQLGAAEVVSPLRSRAASARMAPDATPRPDEPAVPLRRETSPPPPESSNHKPGGPLTTGTPHAGTAPTAVPVSVRALASPPRSRAWREPPPPGSPQQASRRAVTPEGTRRCSPAVIACPMLWSEKELATVVGCLGVHPGAAERLASARLGGASQLVEMSNAQMSQDFGFAAPLERLVIRRTLQHLLDADRWANSSRGRSLRDVLDDSTLRRCLIPMERLTLQCNISQGGFGVVYKGVLRAAAAAAAPPPPPGAPAPRLPGGGGGREEVVAVKEMLGDHRVRITELLKEAHVMASLRHPNICRFIGVCTDGKPKGKRYIVSELLHCSLFDLVHRPSKVPYNSGMSLPLVILLCEGICSGVAYLHGRNLVHADLKSSNILIDLSRRPQADGRPVPRICDFGHAAVRTSSLPHDRLCTPHWAAPEVLRGEGLGPAADVFSVGVLLWEMLAARVPHHDLGFGHVLASVGWAGAIPEMALLPDGLPPEILRLTENCLRFLPAERITSADARLRLQRLPKLLRRRALDMLFGFLGCGC